MNKKSTRKSIRLKRNLRARVLEGHPWAYKSEIEKLLPESHSGESVSLQDSRGRFLGSGIYNPKSQIIWRRFSTKEAAFDRTYLQKAITASVAKRTPEACQRLVWSEADNLPGLVVDRFEDILIVQALTMAVDRQTDAIREILTELLSPADIVFRYDAPSRNYEGLDLRVYTASGNTIPSRWVKIDGLEYKLDLVEGQKTGFYLDQREQHRRIAKLAQGKTMLDGFCHLGGFGLQAMKSSAKSVLSVDISKDATAAVVENAKKNQLNIDVETANLFDWLREYENRKFDLIVLDPPSFARNKKAIDGALRGYKELNLRALKMLNPGGILATYSCSQAIDAAAFTNVVRSAAADAHRPCTIMEHTAQPADHPMSLTMPESWYLKGLILRVE
ncbi:class I SAM-dependent rRNA methyltransferase [Rubellicoccus peritrichatus]|uniref:Class I SAM-dependent rRNA methyltransferase n=1 Tax=Rubellicoccus peritrichatus TaxID=3080537 RepID=A0AAQ3QTU8_9BACT|nr:class I SAM-dependent rRNA methyltransferase [Puniceicoccus sp. CR14]WOO39783.1 class I SAM-dependent rRNA methyltransferase [Puniceicoccus sp. CR14]